MSEQQAVVLRGVIELGVEDADDGERNKSRTDAWARTRRYHAGEVVTLPLADYTRLLAAGIVAPVT